MWYNIVMQKVKIFTALDCPNCDDLKQYLKAKSIDFEEINLSEDKNAAALIVQKTGFSVVPQIQIDEQFIVGFDQQKG